MSTARPKHFQSTWRRRACVGGLPYESQIRYWPGYDCRVKCEHEKKGDHGQHGDTFCLVVRLVDEEVALDLLCMTYARDGKVCSPGLAGDQGLVTLPQVTLHLSFPTTEEHVLSGCGQECDILIGGRCYSTGGSFGWGDKLWTAADTVEAGDAILSIPAHHLVFDGLSIWDRLARELVDALPRYKAESEALPVRCEHCEGKGLIAKKGVKRG
jgi:hypothetical protein